MTDLRSLKKKFVLEFLELYKSSPCLWKVKSKEYSDRQIKDLAYGKLVDKLREQIPEADRVMVVKKLDSIRGSFRKECRKIIESKKSGTSNIYKPRLWYFNKLSFLDYRKRKQKKFSPRKVVHENSISESEQESLSESPSTTLSTAPTLKESTVNSNTPLRNTSNNNSIAVLSDNTLNKVNERLDSDGGEDYFNIVAKHLASKLRKLPEEVAKVTEKLMFDLVYEADLGYVDRYTKLHLFNTGVPAQSVHKNTTPAAFDENDHIGQQNYSSTECPISYDEDDRKPDIKISVCHIIDDEENNSMGT